MANDWQVAEILHWCKQGHTAFHKTTSKINEKVTVLSALFPDVQVQQNITWSQHKPQTVKCVWRMHALIL